MLGSGGELGGTVANGVYGGLGERLALGIERADGLRAGAIMSYDWQLVVSGAPRTTATQGRERLQVVFWVGRGEHEREPLVSWSCGQSRSLRGPSLLLPLLPLHAQLKVLQLFLESSPSLVSPSARPSLLRGRVGAPCRTFNLLLLDVSIV